MKSLLLIGGLMGFVGGLALSWSQENGWPASLWHACLAAYVTSVLMRWWGTAWRNNLQRALLERDQMAAAGDNSLAVPDGSKP